MLPLPFPIYLSQSSNIKSCQIAILFNDPDAEIEASNSESKELCQLQLIQ
jgi:hypothetical protein